MLPINYLYIYIYTLNIQDCFETVDPLIVLRSPLEPDNECYKGWPATTRRHEGWGTEDGTFGAFIESVESAFMCSCV